jgi:hypothetical protein
MTTRLGIPHPANVPTLVFAVLIFMASGSSPLGATGACEAAAGPSSLTIRHVSEYDFRGIRLGITMQEWRDLPPLRQDSPEDGKCSARTQSWMHHFQIIQDEEAVAGVVKCLYTAYIDLGGVGLNNAGDITLSFLPVSDEGGTLHLYQIAFWDVGTAFDTIVSGLKQKYGPPISCNESSLNATWTSPNSEIEIAPVDPLDTSISRWVNVIYTEKGLSKKLHVLEKSFSAPPARM